MRGKAGSFSLPGPLSGITPAYAGKRPARGRDTRHVWDHPRVCGEKTQLGKHFKVREGSPPRMRGKGPYGLAKALTGRITPAYAGKSEQAKKEITENGDHPRVCGEKRQNAHFFAPLLGSPPRMRGKVKQNKKQEPINRITPAYAGKRLKRSRSTVPPVAIVPLFPSVCNKPVVLDGSPAGRDAPLFLPAENAAPALPAYNLRSL